MFDFMGGSAFQILSRGSNQFFSLPTTMDEPIYYFGPISKKVACVLCIVCFPIAPFAYCFPCDVRKESYIFELNIFEEEEKESYFRDKLNKLIIEEEEEESEEGEFIQV
jgi:hypothetical protein